MATAKIKYWLELGNERGDALVKWAPSRKHKIINTMFLKKAGGRRTWKSPNSTTKAEIDYVLTNRPDVVTDVTVINQVSSGSDDRMVMSTIKLNVEVDGKNN